MNFKLKNANGEEQIFNNVSTLQVTKTDNSIGYFDERQEPSADAYLSEDYLKLIYEAGEQIDEEFSLNFTTLRFTKDSSYIVGASEICNIGKTNNDDIKAYKNRTNLIIYSPNTIKGFDCIESEAEGKFRTMLVLVSAPDDEEPTIVALGRVKTINLDNFDTSEMTSFAAMFTVIDVLENELEVINGLDKLDTSNVVDMEEMFNYQQHLTTLDISNFNMQNVTNTRFMFADCSNLTTIYVSQENSDWSSYNITDSAVMFGGSTLLPNYDESKTDIQGAKLTTQGGYFTLKEAN